MLSRRAGKERLGISLARAAVEGEQVSVVLYDINRLKDVNDLHGHAEGDYLIRSAAKRRTMRNSVPTITGSA